MPYSDRSGCPCDFCTTFGPDTQRAYGEGRAARAAGTSLDDNPYDYFRADPTEHGAWAAGFLGLPSDTYILETPPMTFRAKFRVLKTYNHHDGLLSVEMGPVKPPSKHNPQDRDVSEENAAFWSASPSGECVIEIQTGQPVGAIGPDEALAANAAVLFRPGACVYLDFRPTKEPSRWTLGSATLHGSGQIDLALYTLYVHGSPFRNGRFKVGIELASTCRKILECVRAGFEPQLEHRAANDGASGETQRWAMTFLPAPG